MTEKKDSLTKSRFDLAKWIVAIFLLIAGFIANYYFVNQPLPLRIAGWLLLSCFILLVIFQTLVGRKLWRFFREAHSEVRKVVWPTRQETFQTTLIVFGVVFLFALIMWGVDLFLTWAISWLTL